MVCKDKQAAGAPEQFYQKMAALFDGSVEDEILEKEEKESSDSRACTPRSQKRSGRQTRKESSIHEQIITSTTR